MLSGTGGMGGICPCGVDIGLLAGGPAVPVDDDPPPEEAEGERWLMINK